MASPPPGGNKRSRLSRDCSCPLERLQSSLVLRLCGMYRLISLCCLLGGVFGRQPAAPQHRADLLPDTEFSCRDKVLGGYYADPDAQCQMFHVCVKVAGVGIQDFRFLCPNGTAFDQEAQICAGWPDVACEPAALYYSSDNFDLYRIGSGFESKKAPAALEDEPDFHLQRAEPDILSGAHSSNFFNNREGKDNQDAQETGGQTKNLVDQPQRKKVIRKLQRRPTESAPKAASTTSRQFTNNFAGSYGPTTTRNIVSTTLRTTSQAPQNNENYNNYNSQRTNNNYQSFRQPSSTSAPVYDQGKYSKPADTPVKTEQTTAQNKNIRLFKSRQQSTPDYKYTENNQQFKSSQQSSTVDYNNYNSGGNQQFDKKQQQPIDYNNYNNENYNGNRESTPRFNKERKQPTYQNQQSTAKINYGSDISAQNNEQKTSPQYNTNTANKNTQQYNQQTTPKYNYNAENDQKYNNNQDYASKITAKTTQQSTPQYNQQYNNQQSSQSAYNGENVQTFDKIKSTTKYSEKKQQFNNNKPSTPEYNNYNADNGQYNQQQTPAPKYNTNLQYDNNNNQQSTPNYYSADYNQQLKTSQSPSSTYQQQQYSTASPPAADYSVNQQYQQRSSTEYQQYSTPRPASPSSVVVNYNNNNNQQKSTPNHQYSTSRQPSNNQQFQQKATPAPFKTNKPDDYDDGQYRPELYEREAGGEYDVTVRQSSRKEAQFEVTQEPELLKAAHSINIAASKNQLARENRPQIHISPSSTATPVIQTPKPTTQAPPRVVVTTAAPARSVYANFAAVTSSAPRPFSLRPEQSSAVPPAPKQAPAKVQSKASVPPNAKPASSKKGKDVSYDYAYYDNSDHYSEYENIEEFGRTSKKQ